MNDAPGCVYSICPICGSKTVDISCKVRCPKCHAIISNCGGD